MVRKCNIDEMLYKEPFKEAEQNNKSSLQNWNMSDNILTTTSDGALPNENSFKQPCPNIFPENITRVSTETAPVVPPRNYNYNQVHSARNMNPNIYNPSMYSPSTFHMNPYIMNNMYGGYGMHMNGLNTNNPESRFIRAAQDTAQPTFQAIETVTQAINSIAFVMQSTFGSLHMSFQAILKMIESFSHARKLLKQFFKSIVTLRFFHKFFTMLVHLMRRLNIISDEAASKLPLLNSETENFSSSLAVWPILTFFGLVFGIPYLISSMLPSKPDDDISSSGKWDPNTDASEPLITIHDFIAQNNQELTISKGQHLRMQKTEFMPQQSSYWILVADENNRTGYVPKNHVRPIQK